MGVEWIFSFIHYFLSLSVPISRGTRYVGYRDSSPFVAGGGVDLWGPGLCLPSDHPSSRILPPRSLLSFAQVHVTMRVVVPSYVP